ncbi:MAG: hypothetical protein ACLRMZ_21255 [Blautia marasmi]
MKSKWIYVGAVLLSLAGVLSIAKFAEPENARCSSISLTIQR